MTENTPTNTPKTADAPQEAELSLEEQLEHLLTQIEEAEPGTLSQDTAPEPAKTDPVQAEIEALLASEPATPSSEPPTNTSDDAQAADETSMLAALESALRDLDPEKDAGHAEPASTTTSDVELQEEINDLLNSAPQLLPEQPEAPPSEPVALEAAAPEAVAAAEPAPSPVPAAELTDEERIAQEIEDLLNVDAPDDAKTPPPNIDDIDKMLANEIDADDDLLGDFHSVQDVTAGIQTQQPPAQDEYAASAQDVAAELDTQPEDLPPVPTPPPNLAAKQAPQEDPLAVLSQIADTAEQADIQYQAQQAELAKKPPIDWAAKLDDARRRLLRTCFVINWPARRFLSLEHRANLGYIALLNLFAAAAVWVYLIVF